MASSTEAAATLLVRWHGGGGGCSGDGGGCSGYGGGGGCSGDHGGGRCGPTDQCTVLKIDDVLSEIFSEPFNIALAATKHFL